MTVRWGRMQRAGAVALPLLSIGFLLLRASTSPDVPFISQDSEAPWIQPPTAVSAELQQWGSAAVPVASFTRRFSAAAGDHAVLRVRALRSFEVILNGVPVTGRSEDTSRWRVETRVELGVRPGQNELRIDVANRHGPALLAARVEGIAEPVFSSAAWSVALDGQPLGAARVADDTRINPLAFTVETPLDALFERRNALALLFVLGAVGFLAGRRVADDRLHDLLPALVLGAAAVGWIYLFGAVFLEIPLEVGFDARHHLYYIEYLRAHGSVPLATDGWSVYHPPLFYAAAGVLQWLGSALGGEAGAAAGVKLIPFLAGFGNVWVAGELCRRLVPEPRAARVYALLFAAVLPMNIYSAAYFSNETFHTFLAGATLLVTVDLILEGEVRTRRLAALAVLLGLCLITKFTGLLVGAVAGFFLLCKLTAVDREPFRRAAGRVALVGLVAAAMAGWFYARNWIHYGNPLMANWGNMPGPTLAWWQQPGFHTLAYFVGFGEALHHPYLSAFHSFWDGVYSTLWGDGGIGGRVSPTDRPAFWNYAYMSLGYLVALPATALLAVGMVRGAAIALFDADPRRRAAFSFLLTTVYAVLFGLLYLALRLPYFAQGKASYGLVVSAPLAVFFALGATTTDSALSRRTPPWVRALFHGWLTVFAASMYLAYAG